MQGARGVSKNTTKSDLSQTNEALLVTASSDNDGDSVLEAEHRRRVRLRGTALGAADKEDGWVEALGIHYLFR